MAFKGTGVVTERLLPFPHHRHVLHVTLAIVTSGKLHLESVIKGLFSTPMFASWLPLGKAGHYSFRIVKKKKRRQILLKVHKCLDERQQIRLEACRKRENRRRLPGQSRELSRSPSNGMRKSGEMSASLSSSFGGLLSCPSHPGMQPFLVFLQSQQIQMRR